MVVPSSWRDAFKAQEALAKLLKTEVDSHLRKAPGDWFTTSRVKEEDSFHQKIETGRIVEIDRLEDFFGAMVVVPLQSDVTNALTFIERFFETKYRRPTDPTRASHEAAAFRFNDIRLYGMLRADDSMPPSPLDEIIFEIQVRTFFQHAWSSATHDLVYKYPRFSWSRSRVAAQIKAMLESAEMTMDAIDTLEQSPVLPRDGSPESHLNEILDVVTAHWSKTDLPGNLKRMTETLDDLCRTLDLDATKLDNLLTKGRNELDGHPDGWSPYQCVVDYFSRYEPEKLARLLRKNGRQLKQIHVTESILIRLNLRYEDCRCAAL
ncbi:hypothetical protein [Microbacterium sp. PAMC22086]|uniref:hypothetical protein n=1 Tax=Microbacterium sp. PAMC22086 TaxID=2861281 RepID=UPI001C62B311|nr:hypothetical protein [Microbacterium sp. PAMC22086]QYG12540.1 hypothetical protein KY497_04510 [Microbacterium sp. PAMC22086]